MSQSHYFCPICPSAIVFRNFSTLFIHIRNEHREESPFNVRCELSVFCGSRYSSFESYRRHLYRCHRNLVESFDNNDAVSSNLVDNLNDRTDSSFHSASDNQSNSIANSESSLYQDEKPDEADETDVLLLNFEQI